MQLKIPRTVILKQITEESLYPFFYSLTMGLDQINALKVNSVTSEKGLSQGKKLIK